MDDQNLWNLLGQAARPSAPPFFAGKVMRQIEATGESRSWLVPVLRWLAPAAITALVILAALPRPSAEPVELSNITTLDLLEMLSPEDHEVLTQAGWPYNSGALTASL